MTFETPDMSLFMWHDTYTDYESDENTKIATKEICEHLDVVLSG
jgi:hypothetical protein